MNSGNGNGAGRRPVVKKQTAIDLEPSHKLEEILSNPVTRAVLRWLTSVNGDAKCFFELLCENYGKWRATTWVLDKLIEKRGWNKETLRVKVFHHQPTVKALALAMRSIGRLGLTAPQRFVAPLMVVWNFTQACNLTCVHCYQKAGRKREVDELTLDEKLDVVNQLADAGVPFLAVAGGEPLVSKDLWPVLELGRQRGIHLTIATNGTLLSPEKVARLKACGVKYVEVSVDSVHAADHDGFRGVEGAWARSIQGIMNCVAGGINTGLATCLTKRNYQQIDDLVALAISLGCHTFSHFNFIPVGRGTEVAGLDITPEEREEVIRKLVRHVQSTRLRVVSTAPQLGRGCIVYGNPDGIFNTGHAGTGPGRKSMVLSRYIGGCGAGRCYCAIQPNGIVTPCVYISGIPVGDLREQKFLEIWNNPLFDTLCDREDRGDHCAVCDFKAYCGGCRARAYAYTGDVTAGDPGCRYNRHEWEEVTARAEQLTLSQ